jgi:hypothetical protein
MSAERPDRPVPTSLEMRLASPPMAILAVVIALAVAFLPLAIDKLRERRSSPPIEITAEPAPSADSAK